MPLRAALRESFLERRERRDRSRVIVGVIRGNANQMSNARIVSAANRFQFGDGLARFACIDERARRRDGLVNLTIARRLRLRSRR